MIDIAANRWFGFQIFANLKYYIFNPPYFRNCSLKFVFNSIVTSGKYEVVGIVSSSYDWLPWSKGPSLKPTVYTRVSAFVPWIIEVWIKFALFAPKNQVEWNKGVNRTVYFYLRPYIYTNMLKYSWWLLYVPEDVVLFNKISLYCNELQFIS